MTKKEFEAKIEEMEHLYCIKTIQAEIYSIRAKRESELMILHQDNRVNKLSEVRAVVECLEIMTFKDGQEIQEEIYKKYKLDTFDTKSEARNKNGVIDFDINVYNNNTFDSVRVIIQCYSITELIERLYSLDCARFDINAINGNEFDYSSYIFIK